MNSAAGVPVLWYQVFKGQPQEPHVMCDLVYWRKYYQRKGNAMFNHGKSLEKTTASVNTKIKDLNDRTVDGEKLMISELKYLKGMDGQQAKQYFDDAKEYFDAANKLDSFKDSPELKLKKMEKQYLKAREKFDDAVQVVDTKKQSYYSAMASLEKVEIKKMMAIKSKKVTHYLKRFEELKRQCEKLVDKYNRALKKTRDCIETVETAGQMYQDTYSLREIARGKHVMANVHNSIELSHSWKHGSKDSQFDEVDVIKIVMNCTAQQLETINVPVFEPYVYTGNKKELWDRMRRELEQEESGSHATLGSRADLDKDDGDKGGDKAEGEENKELTKDEKKRAKKQRKQKAFVVVVAYKKQTKQELSLKKGELVIPILKENEDGFGYGEVRRGKFGKKKCGFFPMSHVVSGTVSGADGTAVSGAVVIGVNGAVVSGADGSVVSRAVVSAVDGAAADKVATSADVDEGETRVMAISILPNADSDNDRDD